jgi:hypothetical protein
MSSSLNSVFQSYLERRKSGSGAQGLSPEMAAALDQVAVDAGEQPQPARRQVRAAVEEQFRTTKEAPPIDPTVAGAALTFAPQVFADARGRLNLTFRIKLGFLIALGVILAAGIAGAIVGGIAGHNVWSLIFGGISVLDLLTFAFTKPLAAVTDVAVASNRLDLTNLRLGSDLQSCDAISDPQDRIRCQTRAWQAADRALKSLSSSS